MTQEQALSILKTGANIFLTGEPGSGKTYTINRFISWLREHGIEPAVTASTGIAATHINGHTIHSWSGIGIRRELTKYDMGRIANNKRVANRVRSAHILIIDEISMLSARTLTLVENACRALRGDREPFGGLQVVLVGDFFQLPPVVAREHDEENSFDSALFETANDDEKSVFAFNSPAWSALDLKVCYLSEQYRQNDQVFLEILSAIRSGTVSARHRELLQTRFLQNTTEDTTQFFSHNVDVDLVNNAKLFKLCGKPRIFDMEKHGPERLTLRLARGCLSPEKLVLKIGAQVMFTKNDTLRRRFVNGTTGTVSGFSKEDGYPIVKTNNNSVIYAEPVEWSVEENGRILARIAQIPLRLAWAITVHKSQGMSLDRAHMDLSDAFEHGQGYVAISRVRTLAGLSIVGFNERALEVHPDIAARDIEFREASRQTEETLESISSAEIEMRQNNFICACGGNLEPVRKNQNDDDNFIIVKSPKKERRWEQTLELIHEGKTIEETALIRGRKTETIIQHLEELFVLGKLNGGDISHLAAGGEKEIAEIHAAFQKFGVDRLKPIYDHFEGHFPYETIRLARLLFDHNAS